jgi:ComF family protein
MSVVAETWNGLLDLLYPPKCLVCGEIGAEEVCQNCRESFRALTPPICDRCGEMISAATADILCPACATGTSYHFTRARAAGIYDGLLRQAILNLKYGEKRRLAAPLGAYLAEFLTTEPFALETFDLLVPVPLHAARLRSRGFNQAALVALEVGKSLNLPVSENALRRTRRTKAQMRLTAAERARNIQGAFEVPNPSLVEGKSILLLDDVLTTLSTAEECARVLMNAGAKRVNVVGIARDL